MGICASDGKLNADEKAMLTRNKRVEGQLRQAKDQSTKFLKVLLLGMSRLWFRQAYLVEHIFMFSSGTGESGKSTIFKQMQILHGAGFTELEKSTYRHIVRKNTLQCMQVLIEGAEQFNIDLKLTVSSIVMIHADD